MALIRQDSVSSWYNSQSSSSIVHDAYAQAIQYFDQQLTQDEEKKAWVRKHHTVEEVFEITKKLITNYHSTQTSSGPGATVRAEAHKWTLAFSERIMAYQKAIDSITQPFDYASIVWGATKFVLQGLLNHAEIAVEFTKAMAEIGDALPRIDFNSTLYPTDYMRDIVARVYAHILLFLRQATKWYSMGTLKRTVSSVFKPWSLTYKDTVEQIRFLTKSVDAVADTASRAELRDVNILLHDCDAKLETLQNAVNSLLQIANQSEQTNVQTLMLTTNISNLSQSISTRLDDQTARICDLQYNDILILLRPLRDPEHNLYSCQSVAKRRRLWTQPASDSKAFIQNLDKWASGQGSWLFILHSGSRAEARTKDLAVEVVTLLKHASFTVYWYLSEKVADDQELALSDILKSFIFQVMFHNPTTLSKDQSMISISKFRGVQSESELMDLLVFLWTQMPKTKTFLVVEIGELLDRSENHKQVATKIETAFRTLVNKISSNNGIIKVLLVSYKSDADMKSDPSQGFIFDVIHSNPMPLHQARRSMLRTRGRGLNHAWPVGKKS